MDYDCEELERTLVGPQAKARISLKLTKVGVDLFIIELVLLVLGVVALCTRLTAFAGNQAKKGENRGGFPHLGFL